MASAKMLVIFWHQYLTNRIAPYYIRTSTSCQARNVVGRHGITQQSPGQLPQHVSVNYLINRLQPLPEGLKSTQIIVSLNPLTEPNRHLVHEEIHYSHPVFDMRAVQAQKELPLVQGDSSIWYCGAWTGFGFHEDGLRSGELVAKDLIESIDSRVRLDSIQDTQ